MLVLQLSSLYLWDNMFTGSLPDSWGRLLQVCCCNCGICHNIKYERASWCPLHVGLNAWFFKFVTPLLLLLLAVLTRPLVYTIYAGVLTCNSYVKQKLQSMCPPV